MVRSTILFWGGAKKEETYYVYICILWVQFTHAYFSSQNKLHLKLHFSVEHNYFIILNRISVQITV